MAFLPRFTFLLRANELLRLDEIAFYDKEALGRFEYPALYLRDRVLRGVSGPSWSVFGAVLYVSGMSTR